jgi:hypothetical protein
MPFPNIDPSLDPPLSQESRSRLEVQPILCVAELEAEARALRAIELATFISSN